MGLEVQSLEFRDFRNYEQMKLSSLSGLVLFVGPNAVGKTNILEGLALTTGLFSFRHPRTEHLVREGFSQALVETRLAGDGRILDVRMVIEDGRKHYALNGKRRNASALRGLLPCVCFIPDDMNLVKGSHAGKRDWIDALGCQLSSNYHAVHSDYVKILRQKNSYLKDEVEHAYLASINEVMAQVGAQLYVLRLRLLNQLTPYVQKFYGEISNQTESVDIRYIPSWEKEKENSFGEECPLVPREQAQAALVEAMERSAEKEHVRKTSVIGPHADHVVFALEGKDARLFASQGQQRSLVLAAKMAEVALIHDRLDQNPVLLLDDVMSELDAARREKFLSLISGDVQTFITSTNLSYFPQGLLENAQVVHLESGFRGEYDE